MSSPTLRSALIGGALITIAVGVFLYLSVDETVGIALAAIGLVDLVTIPFVLGVVARNRSTSGAAPEPSPREPDPDYNPYARED
jgi:hypothetical protein